MEVSAPSDGIGVSVLQVAGSESGGLFKSQIIPTAEARRLLFPSNFECTSFGWMEPTHGQRREIRTLNFRAT
jgi:hypothetical protein